MAEWLPGAPAGKSLYPATAVAYSTGGAGHQMSCERGPPGNGRSEKILLRAAPAEMAGPGILVAANPAANRPGAAEAPPHRGRKGTRAEKTNNFPALFAPSIH